MALSLLRCDIRALSSVFVRHECQLTSVRSLFTSQSPKAASRQGAPWGDIAHDFTNSRPRRPSTEQNWKDSSKRFMDTATNRHANAGRSVEVKDSNIARAVQTLNRMVTTNGINREWFTNNRRVQHGEYLRDLRRKRWRLRFAGEVGRKVQLVKEIRRRESHARW